MERYQRLQQPAEPDRKTMWRALMSLIMRMDENIARVFRDVTERPQLDTVLLEAKALVATSTNLVQHKLGRKARGFRVCKIDTSATVWWNTSSTADLTQYIPLECSSDCTVSLEVF